MRLQRQRSEALLLSTHHMRKKENELELKTNKGRIQWKNIINTDPNSTQCPHPSLVTLGFSTPTEDHTIPMVWIVAYLFTFEHIYIYVYISIYACYVILVYASSKSPEKDQEKENTVCKDPISPNFLILNF